MLTSIRHTLRALMRTPTISVAAVVRLALGIGATTAIFGVVDAAMLQPLPWPGSDRLMDLSLTMRSPDLPDTRSMVWSYPTYETMRALQATDDRDGAAPAAVLGHALWMRRFGGDSALVGREIPIGRERVTVVGVAAPGFRALSGEVALWLPMALAPRLSYPEILSERWSHSFDAVGRLREGVTIAAAQGEMVTLGARVEAAHPLPVVEAGTAWGALATPLREARTEPTMSRAVLLLFGLVFGISSTDPLTYTGQTALIVTACVLASYLPARRAARIDPVETLRGI